MPQIRMARAGNARVRELKSLSAEAAPLGGYGVPR